MQRRSLVGIDENGLGPRLGPLVVTAVHAIVDDDAGAAIVGRKPRGGLAQRLGDSKAFLSHGDVELGEAWARAIAQRMNLAMSAPDGLLRGLALEDAQSLRKACPPHVEQQCWGTDQETFQAPPAMVQQAHADLERLAERGLRVVSARMAIVCTNRLNRAMDTGSSRFDVDLWEMERLFLSFAPGTDGTLDAVCGKVGGYARYGRAFGPLAGQLHTVLEEGPDRSSYHFPGTGTISFVKDADAGHLLVSMASMVGKWARELLMSRIVRHYGESAAGHDASGYHDPVTERFFQATAEMRRTQAVPLECFERRPASRSSASEARPRAGARKSSP